MIPLAHALARAVADAPWERASLVERCAAVLGERPRWIHAVARRLTAVFAVSPGGEHADALAEVISSTPSFRSACAAQPSVVRRWPTPAVALEALRHDWEVPRIATPGELARWAEVSLDALEGMADVRGFNRAGVEASVRHYRVRWEPKRRGGWRPIEAPKPRLKALQRRILDEIVSAIPTHPAAHAFVRRRSALTHARTHAGRAVVVRFDLADFFTSVHATLVRAIFREAGYSDAVSALLAGLCTARTSREDLSRRPRARLGDAQSRRLREPHLPQGAPCSPALANLALYRLDRRLHGLALSLRATYSRYADDLTFSADARLGRLPSLVEAIARDEGFALRHDKTRVMTRSTRQEVTGLVVNEGAAVPRDEFDRLRAILHRCATRGVAAVELGEVGDLRAHLAGRVAWVRATNPRRGARLDALFERIAWGER